MSISKKRILCIDGGGIKGTFPASFLSSIEENLEHPIGNYFDLIVGTSTGGIIAIGLSMGLRASELLDFYEKHGSKIFNKKLSDKFSLISNPILFLKQLFCSKYSSDELKNVLEEILGDKQIGEAKQRLVIPSWSNSLKSVHVYKTAHNERFIHDYKEKAVDVSLSTSAAPTYFKQHSSSQFIDGGIWANNPIAIAVVEAIGVLGWKASELQVLSLGCLDDSYDIPRNPGYLSIFTKIINLFMDGQSKSAMGIAKILTGDPHNRKAIYRVNKKVPKNLFKLDDVTKIEELKSLGKSYARTYYPIVKDIFFDKVAEDFIPFHKIKGGK